MVENGVDQVTSNISEFMFGDSNKKKAGSSKIQNGGLGDIFGGILGKDDPNQNNNEELSSKNMSMGYFSNIFCEEIDENDETIQKKNTIDNENSNMSNFGDISKFLSTRDSNRANLLEKEESLNQSKFEVNNDNIKKKIKNKSSKKLTKKNTIKKKKLKKREKRKVVNHQEITNRGDNLSELSTKDNIDALRIFNFQ